VDWVACGVTSPWISETYGGKTCNSDYAFAAAGALESAYQIKLNNIPVPWDLS
jgi:hypothetical protein